MLESINPIRILQQQIQHANWAKRDPTGGEAREKFGTAIRFNDQLPNPVESRRDPRGTADRGRASTDPLSLARSLNPSGRPIQIYEARALNSPHDHFNLPRGQWRAGGADKAQIEVSRHDTHTLVIRSDPNTNGQIAGVRVGVLGIAQQ